MDHQIPVQGGFRTKRFSPGDLVRFTEYAAQMLGADRFSRYVESAECDPLPQNVPGSGTSAKYRLLGYPHTVYDWQLEYGERF